MSGHESISLWLSKHAHRQHIKAQLAVLQLSQQLKRQLLLKLAQRVLLRPQPQLKCLQGTAQHSTAGRSMQIASFPIDPTHSLVCEEQAE
jgi:hypothetical protein